MDMANRSAATVQKASRIACRMANTCVNFNVFLPGRYIGEGQLALSITGVAVDVFVHSQFAGFPGSIVFSTVRCQMIAPVTASIAASVLDAASV